jgi:hypothetical protein
MQDQTEQIRAAVRAYGNWLVANADAADRTDGSDPVAAADQDRTPDSDGAEDGF